jgi:hypothetical protein
MQAHNTKTTFQNTTTSDSQSRSWYWQHPWHVDLTISLLPKFQTNISLSVIHLTPHTCPRNPHSQVIHPYRWSTEITVVECFKLFYNSENTIRWMTKSFSSSQIPACNWWQIYWLLMSLCVNHDFLMERFIRTLDLWERSTSQKCYALVQARLFLATLTVQGVQAVCNTKQNM